MMPDIGTAPRCGDGPAPLARPTEIEITPEMIEAGVMTLWESGAVENPLEADRRIIERVFRAMWNTKHCA
jgi:hypothetical protein